MLQNILHCIGQFPPSLNRSLFGPFKMSLSRVETCHSAGWLPENLPGQAEEFAYAFSRLGSCIQPKCNRNDNCKPFLLQMISWHKRNQSSCLSYFIIGAGWPEMQFHHLWFRMTQGWWEYTARQKGMLGGSFLLNQIKETVPLQKLHSWGIYYKLCNHMVLPWKEID